MEDKVKKILMIVFFMELLVCFEYSSMIPIISYLAEYFSMKMSDAQYLNIGFYLVGGITPILGMMGDRNGNKIVINIALILLAIGTFVCGAVKSPFLFAAGRAFSGAAYMLMNAVLFAYVSSYVVYEKRGKASGIIKLAFGCGMILGPIISTKIIAMYSIKTFYWMIFTVTLFVFILSLGLPNNKTEQSKENEIDYRKALSVVMTPVSLKIILSIILFLTAFLLELNYLSIWLTEQFALGVERIGMIYTLNSVGTILGIIACMYLSDRLGKHKFALVLQSLMCIAIAIVPYQSNIKLVMMLTLIIMFGADGAITAIQTMSSEIFPQNRTLFMTLITFGISFGGFLASIIGPSIYNFGGFILNLRFSLVLTIISMILFYSISKDKRLMEQLGE